VATFIYFMCAATSAACAVLLLRSYSRTGLKLLLWSGLCFAFLTLSNVLLVIDLVFVPNMTFALPRNILTLSGLFVLIYSLVWETR
jgi:uncharacterized protein DUF5985